MIQLFAESNASMSADKGMLNRRDSDILVLWFITLFHMCFTMDTDKMQVVSTTTVVELLRKL